jgi:hypothetical protein
MRTYKIKYKATFEGIIEVRAEDKERAKYIVNQAFGVSIDTPSKTGWDSNDEEDEGIVDWIFDSHAEKITIK